MSKITELDVHILNVNHGDCIVIIGRNEDTPSFSMLIDGGSGGTISAQLLIDKIKFPMDPESRKPIIHQLVASHHDRDHLGGLVKILKEDKFLVKQAWLPVLFNPPGYSWLSLNDQSTFTEDAIANPNLAREKALQQIQTLAKDALLRTHNTSENDIGKLMEQSTNTPQIFNHSVRPGTSLNNEDTTAQADVEDVLEEAFTTTEENALHFLQSLARHGAGIPGVVGCGTFGNRDLETDDVDGGSFLSQQATIMDKRNAASKRSRPSSEILRHDTTFVAMMAARAAYNVGLTTKFVELCKQQNIQMEMPLTRRKKLRAQDVSNLADGITLTRLAPTHELVEEKKKKLMPPKGVFAYSALTHTVTVPNKVSYVFRLQMSESSVLLTGDSGFTDFYNWRSKEFDDLRLEQMSKCQLIKVPHHGGHFEYWGKCVRHLLTEKKPVGNIFITSLGSAHANPSHEFEQTAILIRQANQKAEFHFTNPPAHDRFDEVCADCSNDIPDMVTYTTSGDGHWHLQTKAITCENYRV